ncbi:MAG TPA: hypothetical protein VHM91_23310 [Verrucomicrobiales bacterium]|nr:hypothetical protein [Verrucomicrobiales bacterium]
MTLRLPIFAFSLSLAGILSAHDGTDSIHNDSFVATSPDEKAWTGDGDYKFATTPDWGAPPKGQAPGSTHGGVVRDKAGNVYVSTNTKGILIYTAEGAFQKAIGAEFKEIHGLNIREEKGEEFIYAAWLGGGHAIKMKLDGTVLLKIPCPMESGKYKDAKQFKVTSVDSAPDGSIFVADGYGLSFIHKFDATGKYLLSFGGDGTDDDHFKTCHGVGVDLRGEKPLLLVCDRANRRLQHFDLNGKFVANVAKNLNLPCAVSFDGKMVAIAELQGRVTILDGSNKEVAHLGDNQDPKQRGNYNVPPDQWKPLLFTAPHGLCWDGKGGLFVEDWNATGRVRHLGRLK